MKLKQTQLNILKNAENLSSKAKTGVSLHCHTQHSKEMLDFVPHYAEKLPIIAQFWRRERDNYLKREGKGIDFATAFWSPPLTPQGVFESEKKQLDDAGLQHIVSLTDHDSINAALEVNEVNGEASAPISMEWTVPFDYGFFHVGVHNLPKAQAAALTATLLEFTFNKEKHTRAYLDEMFSLLNNIPQVLVVLNHPLWDIEIVGKERHELLLKEFIKAHGRWIHAFEINGFRSWSENKAVIELAEALSVSIVTGGDRHGCKPNTVINLTNAETFDEFADEIRVQKLSKVALMPAYEQPLHSRQLQSFAEILKFYPDFPEGRRRWFDRVHFDIGDGHGVRPVSVHWDRGGPTWLRVAIRTLGIFGSRAMLPAFRLARKKEDRVPDFVEDAGFEIRSRDDIIGSLSSDAV